MSINTTKLYLRLTGCVLVLAMAGCTVGPDYEKPEISLPQQWHSDLDQGLTSAPTNPESLATWWTQLQDSTLSDLIGRAIANNLDLQEAQARVREARAAHGVTQAGTGPTLNATGSSTWSHSRGEGGTGDTTELHDAGFDAGWELDIFGGTRRSLEAADADLQASQEDLHDTLVTLIAEVALNYVELRAEQAQLDAVQASLASQSETYQLTAWQAEAQLTDALAVHQAKYNLESTRSQIPTLHSSIKEAMNRIAVLLGQRPGTLDEKLSDPQPVPVCPQEVTVGVPADILRQRPDIRQAERELAAQTARIGEATADLYPKFSLAGSIGTQAVSLINDTSTTLSGGPQVTWAIFDGGAIRQNIEMQTAVQQQVLLQYETAVLEALEEVENALTAYQNEQTRRVSLQAATDAARTAAELARIEYEGGQVDFSEVLEAQRSLLSFESDLAQSEGNVTSNLISLYKALGGGWDLPSDIATQVSQDQDKETQHDIDS